MRGGAQRGEGGGGGGGEGGGRPGGGERSLLTVKKCLKVGKHNALSRNTASGRTGSSI
jgi:hypothetical protein